MEMKYIFSRTIHSGPWPNQLVKWVPGFIHPTPQEGRGVADKIAHSYQTTAN